MGQQPIDAARSRVTIPVCTIVGSEALGSVAADAIAELVQVPLRQQHPTDLDFAGVTRIDAAFARTLVRRLLEQVSPYTLMQQLEITRLYDEGASLIMQALGQAYMRSG